MINKPLIIRKNFFNKQSYNQQKFLNRKLIESFQFISTLESNAYPLNDIITHIHEFTVYSTKPSEKRLQFISTHESYA